MTEKEKSPVNATIRCGGRLKVIEDVVEGFENLPDALIGLLHGKNRGKRMVRIA